MRVIEGNNDTLEYSNYFINSTDGILQVTIDDPCPDDNFYINFIRSNNRVVIADSESDRSDPFYYDQELSWYSVKYDRNGNSQVNFDFVLL